MKANPAFLFTPSQTGRLSPPSSTAASWTVTQHSWDLHLTQTQSELRRPRSCDIQLLPYITGKPNFRVCSRFLSRTNYVSGEYSGVLVTCHTSLVRTRPSPQLPRKGRIRTKRGAKERPSDLPPKHPLPTVRYLVCAPGADLTISLILTIPPANHTERHRDHAGPDYPY